jgi:hypothetical protein
MLRRLLTRRFSQAATAAPTIEEYTKAVQYVSEQQFGLAEIEFNNCLEILKNGGMYGEPSYNFILQRVASVQRVQGKIEATEQTMEEVVSNYKARSDEHR